MAVEEGSDASAAAALARHSHQDYPQRHQETKRRPVEQRVQPELERHSRCHLEEKGKQPVRSVKTEGLFVFPSQHVAQSTQNPEIRVLLEDLKTERLETELCLLYLQSMAGPVAALAEIIPRGVRCAIGWPEE